jgi:MOSC domain-containing protein YiiM
VTLPRTPCATFARYLGEERWVKRFTVANRTGAYLRVVRTGELRAGDAVTVCYRPEHGVTLQDWFGAWTGRGADPERAADIARRLLAAHLGGDTTLADELRERAEIAAGHGVDD